jgi:hypothetical protein
MEKIPTEFALIELDKLINHILDEIVPFRFRDTYTLNEFLLDCLYKLAKKSEDDLMLVEEYLNGVIEELKLTGKNYKPILFHIDRMVEYFRDNIESNYDVNDLKEILSKVR